MKCGNPTTDDCGTGSVNKSDIDAYDRSADRRTILANAAFVTGGVVVLTGLALALLNRPTRVKREARDGDISATVWLGVDGDDVGAQVSMSF